MTSFKRRFLTRYFTKSQSQGLRECGNWRGTRWDWEKWEREVSWQSIRLNLKLGCLESWRRCPFIGLHFVTVRSLDERLWWNGSSRTVTVKSWSSDPRWRAQMLHLIGIIKTPESRSLDRDRAVQMRSVDKRFKKRFKSPPLILDLTVRMIPARFNLDRYNGLNSARVLITISGPRPPDQRVDLPMRCWSDAPRRATSPALR